MRGLILTLAASVVAASPPQQNIPQPLLPPLASPPCPSASPPQPQLPPQLPSPPLPQQPLASRFTFDCSFCPGWRPGWRTWCAFCACLTCAAVAAVSIYLSFLPASLISIDSRDGSAAISLKPHFTTDRIGQVALGWQQGEGLLKLTPRMLRPVRRDLRAGIERCLDDAAATLSGDKVLIDSITMDERLRECLQVLKRQVVNAIDDFLRQGRLHLPRLVVHLLHELLWAEDDVLLHELARQLGILATALVQARPSTRSSFLLTPPLLPPDTHQFFLPDLSTPSPWTLTTPSDCALLPLSPYCPLLVTVAAGEATRELVGQPCAPAAGGKGSRPI